MGESREEKAEDYWHELAILRGQENDRLHSALRVARSYRRAQGSMKRTWGRRLDEALAELLEPLP